MATEEVFDTSIQASSDWDTAKRKLLSIVERRCHSLRHLDLMCDMGVLDLVLDEAAVLGNLGLIRSGLGYDQLMTRVAQKVTINFNRSFEARLQDLVNTAKERPMAVVQWGKIRTWGQDHPHPYPSVQVGKMRFFCETVGFTRPVSSLRRAEEFHRAGLAYADVNAFIEYVRANYWHLRQTERAVYIQDRAKPEETLGIRWANYNYNDPVITNEPEGYLLMARLP